jgi:aerotaxis receptor
MGDGKSLEQDGWGDNSMKINQPVTQVEKNYGDEVEIISTTDLKGILRTANDDFVMMSGFEWEELKDRNHNIIRHPDMPPEAYADLWSHIKDNKPWMGIVKNRCKNGDHYWVDAFASPQYENGQVIGYQSVRVKPKREWVNRADKLYNKVMSSKSDEDKRRSTLADVKLTRMPTWACGICAKLGAAFAVTLLPVMIFFGFMSDLTLASLIGGYVATVALGLAGVKYVLRPLMRIVEQSKEVAVNPLAQYIYTGLNDEVGQLGYALQFSTAKLRTAIGRVRESSEVLEKSASEIASGNAELSQRTEEQASSLEETASSMEEMTATVRHNADNARQANQLAVSAREQAEKGGEVVGKAVNAMAEINNSSKRIADIIGVIDEIAFQTNLLALNAAVEAARAGEQGRGFAVVAGEVRTPAGRSAESAKEIKDLIEDSVSKVEQGTTLVDESGKTLEEIVGGVRKVTDIIAEMAASSQEQATGIEQVNKAVMQMDEITQQNAALVEEAADASHAMEEKTRMLSGLALQFKEER